jgi:cytoskeletal protein RodZ
MTTRDHVRRRTGDRDADRAYAAEAGPTLPERLVAARERKGVDLYRAERDTKIRARYLAALEHGEYAELPGAVYTKGFLRNYATYLGLDADDVVRQWRRERGEQQVPAEPVLAVPKPLAAPRQGFTFSPVIIVAALLTIVIGLFAVYIGVQLVRFAKPPTLAVTAPAQAVIEVEEDITSYVIRGTSIAGATVQVQDTGREQPYLATADADGDWVQEVQLRRGRNQFDISALDPETGKTSENTEKVFITVPFLVIEAPTLTVDSPEDGAQFENGAIPVRGSTTNAQTVSVSAIQTATEDGTPIATPQPTVAPDPSASAPPEVPAGPTVGPINLAVGPDGAFDTPLDLEEGGWQIAVTATSAEGKTTTLTRDVTIAYSGVTLVIEVKGSNAWLKVWVDGKVSKVTGVAGQVYNPGKTLTFTADESIEVRTGKSSATYFTLNGEDIGRMSRQSNPETWLFAPPDPPVQTDRS